VTDPGLNFGGGMKRLGIKSTFATKLAKHSVKQRETTVIGGGTNSRFALPSESGSVVEESWFEIMNTFSIKRIKTLIISKPTTQYAYLLILHIYILLLYITTRNKVATFTTAA